MRIQYQCTVFYYAKQVKLSTKNSFTVHSKFALNCVNKKMQQQKQTTLKYKISACNSSSLINKLVCLVEGIKCDIDVNSNWLEFMGKCDH